MPGTTGTQKLTYPVSTDILKEQAQYLETLARQMDARTGASADALARQLNRPFAIIDCTVENQISATNSASLPLFDTVVVDTAGLVDLSSDRRVINLNSTGYWMIGVYLDFVGVPGGSSCATIGSINAQLRCDNGTPNRWSNYVKDQNTGHSYVHVTGLTQIISPSAPGVVYSNASISAGTGCANLFNVSRARMWAFKVREL